jgi:hypothetical protein
MRVNFYIQDKDRDVLEHLESQYNKSRYIVELMKRDMKKETVLDKEEIIKLIKQYAGIGSSNDIQEAISTMFE